MVLIHIYIKLFIRIMLLSKNHTILTPDFCVIGAGSGGLYFVSVVVQLGDSVFCRGEMGGDCLNYGYVSSKDLIAAVRYSYKNKRGDIFGCHTE